MEEISATIVSLMVLICVTMSDKLSFLPQFAHYLRIRPFCDKLSVHFGVF